MNENNTASGNNLARLATSAIFGIAGGVLLIIINFLLGKLVPAIGMGIGFIAIIAGTAGLFSKDRDDKKAGAAALVTGIILLLAFRGVGPVKAIAGTVLSIASFVSIATGIMNGLRFLIGLKKRM